MGSLLERSPLPRTSWNRSVISPWFSLCAVNRSFHQQLHSSPKIRIPTHPHHTSAFFISRPIAAQNHSRIGRDPQHFQLNERRIRACRNFLLSLHLTRLYSRETGAKPNFLRITILCAFSPHFDSCGQVCSNLKFHFRFSPRLSCFDALVFCTPPRFPGTCDAALPSPDLPFSPANPSIPFNMRFSRDSLLDPRLYLSL
jgi:hypothetical protein